MAWPSHLCNYRTAKQARSCLHEATRRAIFNGNFIHVVLVIFLKQVVSFQGDHNHLFIRQGTGLQGQAVFNTKLTFRPHSTKSATHKKMTNRLAMRHNQNQQKVIYFMQIRIFTNTILNCLCCFWQNLTLKYGIALASWLF